MANERQIKQIIGRNIKCSHYKTFNEMQDVIKLGNALLLGLECPLPSFAVPKVQLMVLNNMLVPLLTQHIITFLHNHNISESFVREVNRCVASLLNFSAPWVDHNIEPIWGDRIIHMYCNHLRSVDKDAFSNPEEIITIYVTQRIKEYHMSLSGWPITMWLYNIFFASFLRGGSESNFYDWFRLDDIFKSTHIDKSTIKDIFTNYIHSYQP